MLYAEITIKIMFDESKLTPEQQAQVVASDKDCFKVHPLETGVNAIENHLRNGQIQSCFNYLKKGLDAVTIEIN